MSEENGNAAATPPPDGRVGGLPPPQPDKPDGDVPSEPALGKSAREANGSGGEPPSNLHMTVNNTGSTEGQNNYNNVESVEANKIKEQKNFHDCTFFKVVKAAGPLRKRLAACRT
jgi:hypothetical protein